MTKTIGISDEVYDRLAALRGPGESFNDLLRRLSGGALLRRMAGTMDADTARNYREAVAEGRRRGDAERDARVRRLVD